ILKILQKNEINSTTAFGISSLLLTEVDTLQAKCLGDLAQYFVDSVKNGGFKGGKCAEFLSNVLRVINSRETIPKGESEVKGSEFKGQIINSICCSRWDPTMAVHMSTMFQGIPLTSDELRFVIEKVLRLFAELDLADQPTAAYQLLLLSAKGHKKLVLEGLCKHYTAQDDANRGRGIMIDSEDLMTESTCLTTLRQIEGTVILHITQAVKQDRELGLQFIKYVKILSQSSGSKVVSPFILSLLLSISQLHHFEDQIFDFLKSTIIKCLRYEEKQQLSLWLRECCPIGPKTMDLVLEAVEHSTYDWDHVTQGLVILGFGLMDSFGPKIVLGVLQDNASNKGHLTPTQLACQLGHKILLKTFKVHEVVRSEILDQIFNHIMKARTPVSHYLDLLSDAVYTAPQLLLESISKIQELIVQVPQLTPKTAEGLLSAIQPLLKLNAFLKDTLMLVLRKAMFSRQLDSRKIGVLGFLLILKHFRVLGGLPSSQVSQPISLSQANVHSRYNAASNEALCLEIVGNLRRCFTQQADIRLSIYQGLYDVLHKNSQLVNPVLDMLLSQLKKYYEPNEGLPPLRLEPCIITQGEQVYLAEPLSHLVGCAQQCLRESIKILSNTSPTDDDDEPESSREPHGVEELQNILETMTKRIIKADMEDFELDKSADFSLATGVGVRNNIFAILLLGLYEVLMEFSFETGKFSPESCKQVLELFSKHNQLGSVVRDKSAAGAGKKGKVTQPKTTNFSLLSLPCIINFIKAIFNDQSNQTDHPTKQPTDGGGVDELRADKDFLPYLVSVATQKLGQVASKGTCEGEQLSEEKLLKSCHMLGRLLYLYYIEKQIADDDTNSRDQKLTSRCLEGLGLVVEIASKHGLDAVHQCLTHLEKEPGNEKERLKESDKIEKIHKHLMKFQRLVATILSEDKEHQNMKDVSVILSVMAHLVIYLPNQGQEYLQVHTWLHKVATEQTIDDAATCRQILSLLLNLSRQTKSLPQLLRTLCQDVHSQLGDIELDCEVDERTNFSVTKSSNCPTTGVVTLVLTYLEDDLDDIDWVIGCHKASMLASPGHLEQATQVESIEKSICTRLGLLVISFVQLTHSAISNKQCSQALLKAVTKLFNTLTALTKHYISMYTNKAGHLGSRFEKLVSLVGKELTPQTYNMIIYLQVSLPFSLLLATTECMDFFQVKAIKQAKMLANLICAIEQMEKFLIQLTKKSKVNLMEHVKVTTSRDFRI
ncbi:unnamed protein product, partial [Lymnaea stagnalis]